MKSPRLDQNSNSNPNSNNLHHAHHHSGMMNLDESIIQTIVSKLGYTAEDVKRYVKEENSFVSVLYHKLMDEQQ
jgi:hypothetical protein